MDKYIIEEVRLKSENRVADRLSFPIHNGDVVIDEGFRFSITLARHDFQKPITKKSFTNSPERKSKRLLRIKELGENSVQVAILEQNSYFEGENTIVTEETESLRTVAYGQEFMVYAKEQVTCGGMAIMYFFVISKIEE